MTWAALPKKHVMNSCDAIESITYIHSHKMELEYSIQKEVFKMLGKVNPHGNVKELLLFHGTAYENIESIFITISLMYGSRLLLCNCELFKPQGEIPWKF